MSDISEVRGVFQDRVFVKRTSGERELGVQGLRVRSLLVNFFFIVKFACPMEASLFVVDPCILIVLVLFLLSSCYIAQYQKDLGR